MPYIHKSYEIRFFSYISLAPSLLVLICTQNCYGPDFFVLFRMWEFYNPVILRSTSESSIVSPVVTCILFVLVVKYVEFLTLFSPILFESFLYWARSSTMTKF